MLGIAGFLLILVGGFLGWSLWLSIPFGAIFFFGNRAALPEQHNQINAMGLPFYIFVAWLLMIASRWIGSFF